MIGFYNYTVILTYIGFASGVTGIILAAGCKSMFWAVFCLMLSGLCDTFDGRIARTSKNRTDDEKMFGIQIDSLSDLICFGVLPGVIGYGLGMKHPLQIAVIVFYILAALIRLAYFNVLELNGHESGPKMYHGLPVTSAALIFPFCYGLKLFIGHDALCYTIVMLLVGIAFVADFRFKKPGFKLIMLMVGIGAAEIVLIYMVKTGIMRL
jgi:CDP-diacylglycerol--serine O-phosphatidyltransferase